ncbi:MAG: hypothetical protein JWS10_2662 [Cypionkella sp.]|uniref:hypothetical protein n=1 Tax=Cypionkella sp. TaxID=2811411 RepID=UPI0026037DE0|nr:hypothetical protein [Cypionkella sp.]MDB5660047.1 hypothetical protein [Cypionkella sp.]
MKRLAHVLIIVASLISAAPARAKPVTLGVEAMRQLAFEAVTAGFAEQALVYADLLLQRDPKDSTALTVRAQALRALGRTQEARVAAKLAWKSAQTASGRYGAAMAMAQALSSEGRRMAAQLWLRRAAQIAPNPRAYAIARRDFGYVKSRNPWVLQFDVSASPASNVNNGSSNSYMSIGGIPILFDIPPDQQALSGFQFGLGLSGTYRFSPTAPNRQTEARVGVMAQAVVLSGDAKDKAPNARAQDYTYTALEFGLTHHRALDAAALNVLHLTGTAGHNWYGGDDLSNYMRASADLDHRFQNGTSLGFGVSGDHTARLDRPIQSSDRLAIKLGYNFALATNRLSLEVEAAQTSSDSVEVNNDAVTLSLGWRKTKPVAGLMLSGGIDLTQQIFADSRYVIGGREDNKVTAQLQMGFQHVEYMGFSPVLTMQATQVQSNTAQNEHRNLGITLGIQSAF